MSNRKRVRRQPTPELVALRQAARCPDCDGRATIRRNGFDLDLHHSPSCPALRQLTGTLHKDAAAVVAKVADALGRSDLTYQPDGETSGFVRTGVVSASGRPW